VSTLEGLVVCLTSLAVCYSATRTTSQISAGPCRPRCRHCTSAAVAGDDAQRYSAAAAAAAVEGGGWRRAGCVEVISHRCEQVSTEALAGSNLNTRHCNMYGNEPGMGPRGLSSSTSRTSPTQSSLALALNTLGLSPGLELHCIGQGKVHAIFFCGGHLPAENLACGRYSELYLVGGSCDAAIPCQHCSNWFILSFTAPLGCLRCFDAVG